MTGSGLAIRRIIPDRGWPGRNGLQVSHIDLHIMVGTLAGSDKWFRQVSAASHYGVGGGGLVCQWIDENDGSWADANRQADCTGVTVEHEGGMAGVPMTDACVEASARLCADISRRYQLGRLWHDESGQRNGRFPAPTISNAPIWRSTACHTSGSSNSRTSIWTTTIVRRTAT